MQPNPDNAILNIMENINVLILIYGFDNLNNVERIIPWSDNGQSYHIFIIAIYIKHIFLTLKSNTFLIHQNLTYLLRTIFNFHFRDLNMYKKELRENFYVNHISDIN